MVYFIDSKISIINQSILIQTEFFGIQLLKFVFINMYYSFFENIKGLIVLRKKCYKQLLLKNILIIIFFMTIPDILCINELHGFLIYLMRFFLLSLSCFIQFKSNNRLSLVIIPLIYIILRLYL